MTMLLLVLQLVYTEVVMENSPSSMFVLKVSASDPDVGANGQISYTLHGADADKFHLDHRTGTMPCVWCPHTRAPSKWWSWRYHRHSAAAQTGSALTGAPKSFLLSCVFIPGSRGRALTSISLHVCQNICSVSGRRPADRPGRYQTDVSQTNREATSTLYI